MENKKYLISIILKAIIFVSAFVGTILSICLADNTGFVMGASALLYFTIQSNIWIAVVELIGLFFILRKKKVNYLWFKVKLVFTVSISLTGLVFWGMLAPTLGAACFTPANILTHAIVPICSVVDYFLVRENYNFKWTDALFTTIPPFYYLAFAGIGFALNWDFGAGNNYPYFFLNWGSPAGAFGFINESPFMGVVYWVIVMIILVVGMGLIYVKFNKKNK